MGTSPYSKTLAEMKTNVGNMIQDTGSSMATIIERLINDRYRDAWRRCLWSEAINNDYTITLVADQTTYDLPEDFEEELFVADLNDGLELKKYQSNTWWKQRTPAYSGGSISSGTSKRYVILKEKIKSDNTGFGVIKFDPTPNNTHTIAMPYKRRCLDLISVSGTATTDTTNKVIDSEATFITDLLVRPGHIVENTSDNIFSRVVSVDSNTQLTCESDVCPDGDESYEIFTSPTISDIEWIIELGAISDAWAYKKQFQKSDYYLNKYEMELRRRISQERYKINQLYQMISESYKVKGIYRLTGENSYDSLT